MRLPALLALTLAAAPGLARADAPAPAGVFPVAEVRPGMEVTAYTVFTGTLIEPFRGRVLGVARNFLGPSRDLVLVHFYEERLAHTGIVHGMSGSPVYIGDRVLGALSMGLSPLPKDAVAGITPLEYMLAEADQRLGGPAPTGPAPTGPPPARPPQGASLESDLPGSFPRGSMLRPIGTPLVCTGLRPEVFAAYRRELEAAGLQPILAAGGGDADLPLGADDLKPGGSLSAVLASGDISLNATGTITWREGNQLLAFGHPFLLQGQVEIPMAPAEVVTTLADMTDAYKVANAGRPVGTIRFDRVTAVAGEVGPVPQMIPMTVRITRDGADLGSYHYQVANNPWLTPLVIQLLAANSLALRWDYDEEATYRLKGAIRLKGRAGLLLQETYTVAPDPRTTSPAALASDVGVAFATLYSNPFTRVEVTSIELRYDTLRLGYIDRLEGVFVDPERVRAGESTNIRVAIRGLRGQRRVVPVVVPIPAWAAGRRLALRVTDAATLRNEAQQAGSIVERASNLDQLLDLLTSRPRQDRLYVQLLAFAPDAILYHKRLPSLPGSVSEVLERGGGPYRRLARALVWESSILAEGIAAGSQELLIEVRP